MDNNVSDPIFNAVNAYLESNDRLAFQINGPWGIGKTYYVKNEVISRLEGYNVIYFSFYGYDDLAAVKKALNIEILKKIIPDRYQSKFSFIENTFLSKYVRFKKLINKVFKRSELIFQFIELGFPFIQDFVIQKNVKNLVFILDDLERISDKIDLRDVLG
ncbi:KAP family NTPase, partial [Enterococcus cecorum]|nr:KAP family NTPase [Enterococcus cecorum]